MIALILASLFATVTLPGGPGIGPDDSGPSLRVRVAAARPGLLAGELHRAGFDVLQADSDGVQLVTEP